MSRNQLDRFTDSEVRKIQLALELDASFLDYGSYLYERLYRLESRDEYLKRDRSTCVKDLANKVIALQERLDEIYLDDDYGVTSLAESVKNEVSRRVTYDNSQSIATGVVRQKERIQAKLKRELEWIDQFKLCIG